MQPRGGRHLAQRRRRAVAAGSTHTGGLRAGAAHRQTARAEVSALRPDGHAGAQRYPRARLRKLAQVRQTHLSQPATPTLAGSARSRLTTEARLQVRRRRIRATAWTSTSSASTRIGSTCSSGTKSTRRRTAIPATAKPSDAWQAFRRRCWR